VFGSEVHEAHSFAFRVLCHFVSLCVFYLAYNASKLCLILLRVNILFQIYFTYPFLWHLIVSADSYVSCSQFGFLITFQLIKFISLFYVVLQILSQRVQSAQRGRKRFLDGDENNQVSGTVRT